MPGFIKAFNKTASSQPLMVIEAHENINDVANGGFKKKHNSPRGASRCQCYTFNRVFCVLNEGGFMNFSHFSTLNITGLAVIWEQKPCGGE